MTIRHALLSAAIAALALTPLAVSAQEKFKIGVISTMSGPAGAFGTDTLSGINLGIKLGGGSQSLGRRCRLARRG